MPWEAGLQLSSGYTVLHRATAEGSSEYLGVKYLSKKQRRKARQGLLTGEELSRAEKKVQKSIARREAKLAAKWGTWRVPVLTSAGGLPPREEFPPFGVPPQECPALRKRGEGVLRKCTRILQRCKQLRQE